MLNTSREIRLSILRISWFINRAEKMLSSNGITELPPGSLPFNYSHAKSEYKTGPQLSGKR